MACAGQCIAYRKADEMRNKRKVGARFEEKACAYLAGKGFCVLERNFQCRQGEVDIIGEEEGYLVFVEVKYRACAKSGSPAEAVTAAKKKRICRTADYYRYLHGIGDDRAIRYDVVAIEGAENTGPDGAQNLEILWYKNAFYHRYAGRNGSGVQ